MSRSSFQHFLWIEPEKRHIDKTYETYFQIHKNSIMTDGMWINKVAISFIDWLADDPLSAPNRQLLPTCLVPRFKSLNNFQDLYKSTPETRKSQANQSCSNLIALRSLLAAFNALSWRHYISHTFFRKKVFVLKSALNWSLCHQIVRLLLFKLLSDEENGKSDLIGHDWSNHT